MAQPSGRCVSCPPPRSIGCTYVTTCAHNASPPSFQRRCVCEDDNSSIGTPTVTVFCRVGRLYMYYLMLSHAVAGGVHRRARFCRLVDDRGGCSVLPLRLTSAEADLRWYSHATCSCWDFAVSTETGAPFRAVRISCCGVWPGVAVPCWMRYVGGFLMRCGLWARTVASTSDYMNENTLTWSSRMTGSADDPVLMTSS